MSITPTIAPTIPRSSLISQKVILLIGLFAEDLVTSTSVPQIARSTTWRIPSRSHQRATKLTVNP
jgi:hypothetical protein